jgi:peptidyl-prolyl cis-trans isomerase C
MIKEFEDAAFAAAPNALVGPLRTSFGYHLVQVLDHRAGGERPYAEVEAQVRAKLVGERADAAAEAKAEELARRISAEQLSGEERLKELADGDLVSFITTPPSAG